MSKSCGELSMSMCNSTQGHKLWVYYISLGASDFKIQKYGLGTNNTFWEIEYAR